MAEPPSIVTIPLPDGHSINTAPSPVHNPKRRSFHTLVIGGGVTGLVTSWILLDRGYRVTVLSKAWANSSHRLTSQIAGALWEYPPAVCGSHTDERSLEHSKDWAMLSYHVWTQLAATLGEEVGVAVIKSNFFFPQELEKDKKQFTKFQEIETSSVRGLLRDASLIEKLGVSPEYGVVDAYQVLAPTINSDQAMYWLMSLVNAKGARFITKEITTDLLALESDLRSRLNVELIINCSGLSSHTLAADKSCFPLRGGLLRYSNDGSAIPKVREAFAVSADVESNGDIIFIVPRNDDTLIVGGFAESDQWNADLTSESPIVQRMKARAESFLPILKNARLDPDYPFAKGLRPARRENVRVERENRVSKSRIIHSYGHGGSGWSFSFGCAVEVASLAQAIMAESDQQGGNCLL